MSRTLIVVSRDGNAQSSQGNALFPGLHWWGRICSLRRQAWRESKQDRGRANNAQRDSEQQRTKVGCQVDRVSMEEERAM